MEQSNIKKKKIPNAPGVYCFIGKRREILYIGKATSLKNRIRSYFDPNIKFKRSELIEKMVAEARFVEWTITDSVIEALILEANLIRSHKPPYNSRAKDDKSYNHVVITDEEFPRVLVVRGKDLIDRYDEHEYKEVFGPFTNGTQFRDALKIIRKLFQFYDTPRPVNAVKSKVVRGQIDFNRQIGLYPSEDSKHEYAHTIRHLILFFQGKKKQIIKELTRDMMRCAKQEEFEKAAQIKRKITALQHIEDIALIKDESRVYRDDRSMRIEAYDVAHLSGDAMVGVMTVVNGGELARSQYRKFKIQTVSSSNDTAALDEILTRRLAHEEWPLPQLIVVDGSTAQIRRAERVLKKHSISIPVVGVVKDEYHRPRRIAGAKRLIEAHEQSILLVNAEAHRFAIAFHTHRRNRSLLNP